VLRSAAEEARAAASDAREALGQLKELAASVRAMTERQEVAIAQLERRTAGTPNEAAGAN
jgi:hypothetical protein